jgi:hypothetical protein
MPVARKTGWRIKSGINAVAAVTSSYAVEAIALQSDQDFSTPWTINGLASDPPTLSRVDVYLDQSKQGDGGVKLKWHMDYMTHGMFGYWLSTYLPGVTYVSKLQSAPVTIMTYDQTDTAVFIQENLYLPETLTPAVGGWKDIDWIFDGGYKIT